MSDVARLAVGAGTAQRRRTGGLRRLLRTPLGLAAVLADLCLILLAVVAPIIWGSGARRYDTANINQASMPGHPFGTDGLGRDVLLRILVATRFSLELAIGASAIAVVFGLLLGTLPLVLGRRSSRFLVAVFNVLVAFPGLILAIFFGSIFGIGAVGAMLALGIAGAPVYARLTHTLGSGIASRDYISAARILGVSRLRLIGRHILPNIAETLIVNMTMGAGGMLLAFAGLSFLGLGVQPPSYDWGRMLQDGLLQIYVNPMAALGPGLAIVLAGLAFNLTGEAAAALAGRRVPISGTALFHDRGSHLSSPSQSGAGSALDVEGLTVRIPVGGAEVITPVRGVDIRVEAGESVGIVGESGSGKSLTALAIAQLLQYPASAEASRLVVAGRDLRQLAPRELRRHLGTRLAMVFQDPMSSLNPVIKVGPQLAEVATEHEGVRRREALERAVDRLHRVRVPAPRHRAHQYPHEFSGGMRQRAMIAMGLMGKPTLLIADEPTTALDVTVQKQVLEVITKVRSDYSTAILLITHDVAVVSAMCDRVLVMYAGRIVEDIPVPGLLAGPRHPYARALLTAVPDMTTRRHEPLATIPGRPPQPASFPVGCAFAPRCPFATSQCEQEEPVLSSLDGGGKVACWHPQVGPVAASREVTGQEPARSDPGTHESKER